MILAVTERGSGPALVLLHGLFGQAANFGAVQRRLAARARVIALDLRNHGASPHASGMRYPELAQDVLETLSRLDALPCVLVGHSMGGKVAMAAALAAPASIVRLAVVDIAPVRYRTRFRPFLAAMEAVPLVGELTRAAADLVLAATISDSADRAFLLRNLALAPTPRWRIGLEEIAAGLDDIEDWPLADAVPFVGSTLFLAGGTSDYIRPEHRPPIRALFPAARFVTFKRAGHLVHADDPEGFAAVIEAFTRAA